QMTSGKGVEGGHEARQGAAVGPTGIRQRLPPGQFFSTRHDDPVTYGFERLRHPLDHGTSGHGVGGLVGAHPAAASPGEAHPDHGPVPASLPSPIMVSRTVLAVAIAVWTLLSWGGRIRLLTESDLDISDRVRSGGSP